MCKFFNRNLGNFMQVDIYGQLEFTNLYHLREFKTLFYAPKALLT